MGDTGRAYDGESLTPEKYTGFDAALDEEKNRYIFPLEFFEGMC